MIHYPNELSDNEAHCQECGGTHYFVNKYHHPEIYEYLWLEIICDNCGTTQSTYKLDKAQVFCDIQDYEECGVKSYDGLHHCPQHPCTHNYNCSNKFNY